MGPKPDPPEPLGDDEWAAVSGLAAVSPSPGVEAALREAAQKASAFEIAVATYQYEERNPHSPPAAGKSARQQMDEARSRAIEAI